MQLLKKLLGGSKKEGYFLELDEIEDSQSVQRETKSKTNQPEKNESVQTQTTKSDKSEEKVSQDSQKSESEKKTEVQSQAIAKSKSSKTNKSSQSKSTSISQWDGPDWAKQLIENSQAQKEQNEPQKAQSNGFASDSLLPVSTGSRRMPGPSLNKFMDMAKEVKTPR